MHDAFLRTIVANPDDDAPRLVYADWLDETEDRANADRAEFIRLQIRLESLPADDPQRPKLAKREKALLKKYAKKWAKPFRDILWWWSFGRGFLEGAAVMTERMSDNFTPLFRDLIERTPLREVTLFQQTGDVACLLPAAPLMKRLRSFRVRGAVFLSESGSNLRTLFESEHLSGLTCLEIEGGRNGSFFGPRILSAILHSPVLKNLTELSVSNYLTDLHPTVLRTLARSPSLANLTRLNLGDTTLDRAALRGILRSDYGPNLETLGLQYCKLERGAWSELIAPDALPNLKRLFLYSADINGTYAGADKPVAKRRLAQLRDRFGADAVDMKQEQPSRPWYYTWR
jgi:uncharacterized protein (TIGR02996 family)